MSAPGPIAPVVLFAYARVDHLRQTVDSLRTNSEAAATALYVFCDGPKHEGHKAQTDAVRRYVDSIDGFASVTRIYREQNLGLARSIISGVTEILSTHNSVIVLEDDLVVSPYFLKFMNEGLLQYRDEERVASIHGYIFPVPEVLPETFFLRGADCWGWATWSRAWRHFEPDGQKLLDALRRDRLARDFDMGGAYPYTKMLTHQVAGKNDSWAVRWHASCFLANKLTLYPGRSLVNNIGTDDSGTHCATTDDFHQVVAAVPVPVLPIELRESAVARDSIARFLGRHTALTTRAKRVITRLWTRAEKIMNVNLRRQFAEGQFKPGILGVFINPFFLARRGLWREIEAASPMLTGDLLDVGCGTKPYKPLFTSRSYTGLEIDTPVARQREVAEAYYDGKSFPFDDESFDAVLCNQVLEHVFTPDDFLREIFRVLKPGGRLLLTVPFVWDEHEQPYDYARYSSFGLRALLERNGLQIVRHRKILADASLLFQLANAYLFKVTGARSTLMKLLLRVFLFAPVSMMGLLASVLLPSNEDFFLDQLVVAERKTAGMEISSC